ncbi:MFS transporter [Pseudonocardia spinosispora]|uniref:MFS transporter n=1 Tax=Pseudonocardia spinosispora TaxID=103441 RepID=UPI000566A424|nr:MFS transporter [Pseudonocardia spinosispora]
MSRRWVVLALVLVVESLDLLNASVTTIAAPTVAADLGGGDLVVEWLGAGYALALGALLVLGGRLGDRHGRRTMFLLGTAGFTLGSAGCGLAVDPTTLIAARLLQGVSGAMVLPQGFGLLASVFPRAELGKAFSAFGPVLGLTTVGGPILGGFILHADLFGLGWRPIFGIDVLLGISAIVVGRRVLPGDTAMPATVIDGLGSGLLGLSMLALLYGLLDGSTHGWTPVPLMLLTAGLLCFALFCWRQRTATHPLIERSLLHNRGFTSGLVLGAVFFAAASGLLYVIPLFLQSGLGQTPLGTALALSPSALGILIASTVANRLLTVLGRGLTVIGLLGVLCGVGWLLLVVPGPRIGAAELAAPVLVIGLGLGSCFGSLYDLTLRDVDVHEAGSGSGSLTAVEQLSNGAGIAAVTTIFFGSARTGDHVTALVTGLLAVAAGLVVCCALVWRLPVRDRQLARG